MPRTAAPAFPPSASATPPSFAKASSSSPSATRSPSQATASQPRAGASSPTWPAKRRPARTSTTRPAPSSDYRTTLHHLGTLIQTDAKLGWSAGGGALVNLRGELVGLTTTAATIAGHEQPAGYAIPINATFRRIIDTLKEGREVEYGMLGISFGSRACSLTATRRGHAAWLSTRCIAGSPAARAGLASGRRRHARRRSADHDDIDAVQLAVSVLPPSTTTTIEYAARRPTGDSASDARKARRGRQERSPRVRPESWRGMRVDYATALEAAELARRRLNRTRTMRKAACWSREVEPDSAAWTGRRAPGHVHQPRRRQRVTTPEEFRAAVRDVGERTGSPLHAAASSRPRRG